jgi:uncharacterized protein
MKPSQEPTIDAFELARTAGLCEGEVGLGRLARLAELLLASDEVLHYRVQGRVDEQGNPGAAMHLVANLPLTCQRCNLPFTFALDRTTLFRFVRDEQELNALPIEDDEIDVVVGARSMPVLPWIEDEAILSLPLVPRHLDCVPVAGSLQAAGRPHPFAALAGLKRETTPRSDDMADADEAPSDEGKDG